MLSNFGAGGASMRRVGLLVIAALPVVFVYAALAHLYLGIPILDDYHAVLGFALDVRQIHGLTQHILYDLTAQNAEYRIMLIHLVLDAELALVGHLSIGAFIWLGNLFFLPLIALFWVNFHPGAGAWEERLALFLPVVFLVFELIYVEQLDWMAGLLYFIVPLVYGAIHLLLRSLTPGHASAFVWALLVTVVACLTSPNGFFLVPLGLWLLWRTPERSYRRMAAWCVAPTAVLAAYLYHYHPVPHASQSLIRRAAFFVSFLGSGVENMHHRPIPYAAVVLGAGLLAVFAHAVWTRFDREQPFLFYSTVWCLLTAALVAFTRADLGLHQSLSVRYKLYCVLMLVFAYVYLLGRIRASGRFAAVERRRWFAGALAASVFFCGVGDVLGYRFLKRRHDGLLAGLAWYAADPATHSPLTHSGELADVPPGVAEEGRRNLNECIAEGLYTLPAIDGVRGSDSHP